MLFGCLRSEVAKTANGLGCNGLSVFVIFASFLPFGRCAAENCVGNVKILECAKISVLCFPSAVGVLGGCFAAGLTLRFVAAVDKFVPVSLLRFWKKS